jgi:murein DD-endopeptidase MepM/ murein hydrolase activator NlpD
VTLQTQIPADRKPTSTLHESCDPSSADFCIVEGHFLFHRPIASPGNDIVEPTYRYGATQSGQREPHHGVEFPNPQGVPVIAAAGGEVVFAGDDSTNPISPWKGVYGNVVVLKHLYVDLPIFTVYGHLSEVDVKVGQQVDAGEEIGKVGATGAAIGSHLHFEVRLGENSYGSTRNPELWLIPREGEGTMAVRVIDENGVPLGVTLNVQRLLNDGTLAAVPQPEAYSLKEKVTVKSDDSYGENFALGGLPAGIYRLSFINLGKLYQRLVEVQPGRLTLVEFTTK